jgi:hypothetical protein
MTVRGGDDPQAMGLKPVARFDLVRLARDLQAERRHPGLVEAVERAAAIGTTRDDLRVALASLEHIARIQDARTNGGAPTIDAHDTLIMGALFTQAVILYARATTTKGARRKLLGEARLSASDRATHKEAMRLRDEAIAHFGRGEGLAEGPIAREAVLFSLFAGEGRQGIQVGTYTVRAQHKVAFSARLAALLKTRLGEIMARAQPLFDAVRDAFEEAGAEDPALRAAIGDYVFDVEAFCASPEAARQMRAELDAGFVTDRDYAVSVPRP